MERTIKYRIWFQAARELRPSLPKDQAGVIHAIYPFWMKLCQIEGSTQKL